LAFRLSEPSVLIDIRRLPELTGITETDAAVRVGALTTHAELGRHEALRRHVPLLEKAVPLIAHPAIRNRGTIGGSLAFADPAAELPAVAVALDATIITAGRDGERAIAATEFFQGLYETALRKREMIAAIEFPKAASGQRTSIVEVAQRSGDYAIAGLAARASVSGGALTDLRLVFFGVGPGPIRATHAEQALEGRSLDAAGTATAAERLADDLDPTTDLHGGPEMKLHLCRVLLRRAIGEMAPIMASEVA
jgi:carbon-monoxide dehydrogenase medium subunit